MTQEKENHNLIRIIIITSLVLMTTILHYQTDQGKMFSHIIFRELYFLPIILAGFWYGLYGGIAASLTVTLLYLPFVLSRPEGIVGHNFGNIMQIVLYNVFGLLIGWLRDRERKQFLKLLEAESLAAMGKAISCIAHDMKTPLMAIGGFVQQVRRKLVEGKLTTKLDMAVEQVRRLETLVGDMLAFAKPLKLECIQGDINDLVKEVMMISQEKASRHNVQIKTELQEMIPGIEFDSCRLQQAIINLVNNAIEVSQPGDMILVRNYVKDSHVIVEIVDQGTGIPKEQHKDIFTPFITTKKEGTGLGLPIVKKVLEAHSGSIRFYENVGKGMTFQVAIPLSQPTVKK